MICHSYISLPEGKYKIFKCLMCTVVLFAYPWFSSAWYDPLLARPDLKMWRPVYGVSMRGDEDPAPHLDCWFLNDQTNVIFPISFFSALGKTEGSWFIMSTNPGWYMQGIQSPAPWPLRPDLVPEDGDSDQAEIVGRDHGRSVWTTTIQKLWGPRLVAWKK